MNKNINGYSLVELMLAIVVSSVVLAGTYASYIIVGTQFQRNEGSSQIHEFAIPTLKILNRDLRMTGYKTLDSDIESTMGIISTPITITDSGNACCDSVRIIFDKDTVRKRHTYYVAARANPIRNALFVDIDTLNSGTWVSERANEIIADYVEDFQVVGSENNSLSQPTLLDISLVFRTKTQDKAVNVFAKPAYTPGNYNYNFIDNYQRIEFSTTILLRNLLQKTY